MDNGKEPAFAAMNEQELFFGLTKREYIATKAMSGILAAETEAGFLEPKEVAKRAVKTADELLSALESTI